MDGIARLEGHRVDETRFGIRVHADHFALGAPDPQLLADAAQQLRVQAGVEVIGISRLALARLAELVRPRHDGLEAEFVQLCLLALVLRLHPVVVELGRPRIGAVPGERVKIALAQPAPVFEFDAELVGAIDRAQERRFVELEQQVKILDRRDRRLADPDRTDLVGLDELDAEILAK